MNPKNKINDFGLGISLIKKYGVRKKENRTLFDEMYGQIRKEKIYTKNNILLGWKRSRRNNKRMNFYLDASDVFHALIIGMTGCLSENENIFVRNEKTGLFLPKKLSNFKNGDIINTLSFDFKNNKVVKSLSKIIDSGLKETFDIKIEDKKIIKASEEHKFFVLENDIIIEKKVCELKVGDMVATIDKRKINSFCFKNKLIFKKIISIKKCEIVKTFDLKTPDYHNFILENGVISHNSGKTVLLRGLQDRFYLSGMSICNLADTKDEMKSSLRPVQKRFRNHIYEKEEPTGHKMKIYRPKFFSMVEGEELPEDNVDFQLNYSDITQEDLFLFLELDKEDHKNIIYKYFKTSNTLEELRDNIENDEARATTKNVIISRINTIIKNEVIGEDFNHDIIQDMNDGYIISQNLSSWKNVNKKYYQLYIRILMRKILEGRKNKKLKNRTVIIIDEASKMVGYEDSISQKEILYMIDTCRQYGIYLFFATQTASDERFSVPQPIIDQSRYVFLANSITVDTAWKILGQKQHYSYHPDDKKILSNRLKYMTFYKGWKPWMVIDSETKKHHQIFVYFCLSEHMTVS